MCGSCLCVGCVVYVTCRVTSCVCVCSCKCVRVRVCVCVCVFFVASETENHVFPCTQQDIPVLPDGLQSVTLTSQTSVPRLQCAWIFRATQALLPRIRKHRAVPRVLFLTSFITMPSQTRSHSTSFRALREVRERPSPASTYNWCHGVLAVVEERRLPDPRSSF